MADMLVPFAEPVAELLVVCTSAELLAADMAAAYSFEPVVGKSAAALAADIVAEAGMLVPFVEPVVADMAAAYSFEPVAGKSAAVLVVDLLGQIVVPSF